MPPTLRDMMILARAVLQIFCWQLYCIKCQNWKGETIQTNKSLPKDNQAICIMYLKSMPHIMILAQAILYIFCWQDCVIVQNASRKREIIQANVNWILPEVNQVICILDKTYEPNIMILAQVVLQILCWQECFMKQNAKVRKGRWLTAKYQQNFAKS